MPLYDYHCDDCLQKRAIFKPLRLLDRTEFCQCGTRTPMRRLISAAAIRTDYSGYSCPVSGKWIEGKRAHEENLKRHGCRVLETGEREAAQRFAQAEETALENKLTETAARLVEAMPSEKKAALGRELETTTDKLVRS